MTRQDQTSKLNNTQQRKENDTHDPNKSINATANKTIVDPASIATSNTGNDSSIPRAKRNAKMCPEEPITSSPAPTTTTTTTTTKQQKVKAKKIAREELRNSGASSAPNQQQQQHEQEFLLDNADNNDTTSGTSPGAVFVPGIGSASTQDQNDDDGDDHGEESGNNTALPHHNESVVHVPEVFLAEEVDPNLAAGATKAAIEQAVQDALKQDEIRRKKEIAQAVVIDGGDDNHNINNNSRNSRNSTQQNFAWVGICVIVLVAVIVTLVVILNNGNNDPSPPPLPTSTPTLSLVPSMSPTTSTPTSVPSLRPTTSQPSKLPTSIPTLTPTISSMPSMSPTFSPEASELLARLRALSFEPQDAFTNPTSGAFQAYQWLISDSNLITLLHGNNTEMLLQRYALANFYFSTNGDNWRRKSSWLSNEHICEWERIVCLETDSTTTATTGTLSELNLDDNRLSGTITPDIGLLSNSTLVRLDLWSTRTQYLNVFHGSIPTEIGKLVNLEYLRIGTDPSAITSGAALGKMPTEIGKLIKLQVLSLASIELTGMIPSEIGNLVQLTSLDLRNNELSGNVPIELSSLSQSLRAIGLDGNSLTGNLDVVFCVFNNNANNNDYNVFRSDCATSTLLNCTCCTACF